MPNYYEYLQVEPIATDEEIQFAINQKYDQCKRLATHDDSTVVQQANLALQSLEKIKEILLFPERRAVYDETLGLNTAVTGSLTTSQQTPIRESPVNPAAIETIQSPAQTSPSTDIIERWKCENCNNLNPAGTRFCLDCGNEVGRPCPKCGTLFEKSKEFCPACGISPQQYAKEQEKLQIETVERQKQEVQLKFNGAETHLAFGMYGLAKDALDGFEGLGTPIPNKAIICKKSDPEWEQAAILDKNANDQRNMIVKQNMLKISIAYAAIGAFLGFVSSWIRLLEYMIRLIGSQSSTFSLTKYVSSFDWSYLYGIVLSLVIFGLCGAIAGVVGSTLYFYQWGGRRPLREDLILAALAPITFLLALALNPIFFGVVVIMAGLWFIMITLGFVTKFPI